MITPSMEEEKENIRPLGVKRLQIDPKVSKAKLQLDFFKPKSSVRLPLNVLKSDHKEKTLQQTNQTVHST
jgi:hypothetical protein